MLTLRKTLGWEGQDACVCTYFKARRQLELLFLRFLLEIIYLTGLELIELVRLAGQWVNPCDLLVSAFSVLILSLKVIILSILPFCCLSFSLEGKVSLCTSVETNSLLLIPWYPCEHRLLMKGTLLSSVVGTATTTNSLQALVTSQEPWKKRHLSGCFRKAQSSYVFFNLKAFPCWAAVLDPHFIRQMASQIHQMHRDPFSIEPQEGDSALAFFGLVQQDLSMSDFVSNRTVWC